MTAFRLSLYKDRAFIINTANDGNIVGALALDQYDILVATCRHHRTEMANLSAAARRDFVRQLFTRAPIVFGAVPDAAARGGLRFYDLKIDPEVIAAIAGGQLAAVTSKRPDSPLAELGPGFTIKMVVIPCVDFDEAVDFQYFFGSTKRHS